MSDSVKEVLADWEFPIWLTLSIAITAIIYLRGWIKIRKTRPSQFTSFQLLSFLAGLAILWMAVGSPMDGFADALLSAHMVEHLLIMSVVPPLLLLGLPGVPLLRGLPLIFLQLFVGPLMRLSWMQRYARWLTSPVAAWMAMNLTYLVWHTPAAYDFALEHEAWHAVEHLCFLFTSLLFWWHIVQPWPSSPRLKGWGVLIYLVSADVINTLLCAFLAFCDRPIYEFYVRNSNPFHVSLVDDQVLGAAIMWVIGSLAFLLPGIVCTMQLLRPVHLTEVSVSFS
ncbi:cytochrome c oxidase assembly protein [Acidicapsa ligni]|uniref:cytochrome c oxidase assembly protein n=1 Tax=Acidicapsa ligni TaxID=542300 RepID=UPI0021E0E367|nr:cytochrome c oxidase assembly protein [Acidicapsa ligni]